MVGSSESPRRKRLHGGWVVCPGIVQAARAFTRLDEVSARDVHSHDGPSYHELEATAEGNSHRAAHGAAIGPGALFLRRGKVPKDDCDQHKCRHIAHEVTAFMLITQSLRGHDHRVD